MAELVGKFPFISVASFKKSYNLCVLLETLCIMPATVGLGPNPAYIHVIHT
jgi:hypothetical protein